MNSACSARTVASPDRSHPNPYPKPEAMHPTRWGFRVWSFGV